MPNDPKNLLWIPAIFVLIAGTPAYADDSAQAEARARAHIKNFSSKSLSDANQSFVATGVTVGPNGEENVRFNRRFKGLDVIGGDMVAHSDSRGASQGFSMSLKRQINVSDRPAVSGADAVRAALAANAGYALNGQPKLVVYARGDTPVLAYDVMVSGTRSDGTPSEKPVIVSAINASIVESWDDIHTAPVTGSGKGYFSGTVALSTNSLTATSFELRDTTRGGQYTINMLNKTTGGSVFTDSNNAWGTGTLGTTADQQQTIGVDAQYGTAVTWDYYKLVHGRNGIRNDGKGAYNRVHYSSKYNNAFWQDSCFCMTYGDGDGVTFNPFDSLDVAGHEMTHGVTSITAKLVYSGESGGLNEATSDIFGTAVEFYANNPNDPGDYFIGEKLYKSGTSALRSMIQPSADGVSADCYYATLGSLDVHYSSGVANHFFYLLAEGSAPNAYSSIGSKTCIAGNTRVASGGAAAPVVTGIGRSKAEKIWYLALTGYMTSSTNYAAARVATINAATALYGAASAEVAAVRTAWSAVLVN